MRKHIDLFDSKKKQEALTPIILKAKKYGFVSLAVLVGILLIEIGTYVWLSKETLKLNEKQVVLSAFLQNSKGVENKISYFLFKKNLLLRYVKDDAQFSTYYTIFKKLLNDKNAEIRIESFSVDKTHKTEFILIFDTYEAAQQFLKNLESPAFLEYFKELKMDNLTVGTRITSDGQTVPTYRLELQGVFKPQNAN